MDAIELGFSTHQTFSRMNSQFFKNPLSEENLKSTKISFPLNSKKKMRGVGNLATKMMNSRQTKRDDGFPRHSDERFVW